MNGTLITAYAMDQDTVQRIEKKFSDHLGSSVTLSVEVDPLLIAGFSVTILHTRFDYSLRTQLEKMREHLLTQ